MRREKRAPAPVVIGALPQARTGWKPCRGRTPHRTLLVEPRRYVPDNRYNITRLQGDCRIAVFTIVYGFRNRHTGTNRSRRLATVARPTGHIVPLGTIACRHPLRIQVIWGTNIVSGQTAVASSAVVWGSSTSGFAVVWG